MDEFRLTDNEALRSLLNCFPLPKRYSADQAPLIWALKISSSTDAANSAPLSKTVPCSLNVDTIIWFQDVDGECHIMTVDAHEIESQDNSDKIRKLIKDAG